MTQTAYATDSNPFSATLSNLAPGTTYYYKAFATVYGTGDYASQSQTFYSATMSFSTPEANGEPALSGKTGWLELPAEADNNSSYFVDWFSSGGERNYSYLYDKSTYTSYWVAYPLTEGHIGGSRNGSWSANPNLSQSSQINIWDSSYGVNYGSTSSDGYDSSKEIYARGHQIPDADRSGISSMQSQTYYATNSTPQIQNQFNAGIWQNLETAVRNAIPANDTLYVATGAILRKTGGNESITYIHPRNDSSKECPVPNYYYKLLLKVKRNSSGSVTSASAIGFWLPHKPYSNSSDWSSYAVSVDQIEQYTGFDFFVNLPPDIQTAAETNSSWSSFSSF